MSESPSTPGFNLRQGRPWIINSIQCRRHEHFLCLHGTEQEGKDTRYQVICTCACHTAGNVTLDVIPKATRRAIVRKENQPCALVAVLIDRSLARSAAAPLIAAEACRATVSAQACTRNS